MNDLGTLGGLGSYPYAINDNGQIVGWSDTKTGSRHAVLWQDGRAIDLGTLGGKTSMARAINGTGQVVGWSRRQKLGLRHAFLWQEAHASPRRACGRLEHGISDQ